MHTRQNMIWHFSLEKQTAVKCTHGKTLFGIFLEKKAPAGKCTRGKIFFCHFSGGKKPLQEDAHTAKYFLAFLLENKMREDAHTAKICLHFSGEKKGPCWKMHTRQHILWHFSCQKKGPCRKMHTRQNTFLAFFFKKASAGKCRHGKIFLQFVNRFSYPIGFVSL